MVAQHEEIRRAEVGLQARLFIVAQGDAFVVVVAQRSQHEGRLLRDRQYAGLLRADRNAGAGVRVQDATGVLARGMDGAVDDEAGLVDLVRRLAELVALLVDRDQ